MNQQKLKILFITQKVDQQDGLLGFIHDWLIELSKQAAALEIICLFKGQIELPTNCRVHSLGKEKAVGKISQLINFYKIAVPLIINKRVDLVFIHMNEIYLWLLLPLKIFLWINKIPIFFWKTHGHLSLKTKIAILWVSKVLTASSLSFPFATAKKTILGHGINIERFSLKNSYQEKARQLAWVGRISPRKDLLTLLKACVILKNKLFNFHLNIIGACPENKNQTELVNAKKFVLENKLDSQISFLGNVPYNKMPAYYQAADLLVSTSQTNSLDKAVLEAMSCGTAILTSNPAFKEILYNEENFFTKENPDQLAEKIIAFAGLSQETRQKTGLELRKIVDSKHNIKTLIQKIITLAYEQ